MILFIIVAIYILFMSTGELIGEIRNKNVSFVDHLKSINGWFWTNIGMNIVNWLGVLTISSVVFFGLCFVCPTERSQWEFNINALQDHMGIEGRFRYGGRGYINDELSYYYSRTMSMG